MKKKDSPFKSGWYCHAEQMRSLNFNQRPSDIDVSLLVIHCISLPLGQYQNTYVEDLFLNRLDLSHDQSFVSLEGVRVSSHFYIKRSGELIQFVSTENRAWHAGKSHYQGRENCNDFSIGIELEGTDHTPFELKQYQTLILLTKALQSQYPQIQNNIVGHSTIAPNRKTDPGVCFDWPLYLSGLKNS